MLGAKLLRRNHRSDPAFKYHRCIIPASGFYEWKSEKGVKQPWYISINTSISPLLSAIRE